MKIYQPNLIRIKIRNLLWKLFNKIENNNNPKIDKNGERQFLKNVLLGSKNKKIIVFDCGANIGNYTLLVKNLALTYNLQVDIHSFEPGKKAYGLLVKQTLNFSNINIINKGVSKQNETAELFFDKAGSGLSSLYNRDLNQYNIKFEKKEKIELLKLSSYIEENKIAKINLLKLDVEGHELNALQGLDGYLNPSFIDFIQFEYGGANIDSQTTLADFYKLLIPSGFIICKIMKNRLEKRDYTYQMENYSYSNYVAVSNKLNLITS